MKISLSIITIIVIVIIGVVAAFAGASPIVLLGFYGAIATVPLIFVLLKKDLMYGLWIWFLLVILNRAIGYISFATLPDIYLYRIMWIILFLTFLACVALRTRHFLPLSKIEIFMILFCLISLGSMIRAGTIYEARQGLILSDFLSGYAIPFSLFFLVKHIVDSEEKTKKMFQFLFIIGIYFTLTGLFEHFHLTSLVFPRYIVDPGVGIHWGRVRGPFLHAAVNGTILGICFLLGIYLTLQERRILPKILYGIPTAVIPITIFFTYTRSCWLGFFLSILIVPFFYPRSRKVFVFLLFIICIAVLINWRNVMSEDRTVGGVTAMSPVYSRIGLGVVSLDVFRKNPIFGVGFYNFENVVSPEFSRRYGTDLLGPHDTMMSILVELGLAGLIPLLLIFFYIFRHSVKLYRGLSFRPFLGKGLVAIFWGAGIIYIVVIQFIEISYFLFPNSLFFLLAGIIVGLNQRALLSKAY